MRVLLVVNSFASSVTARGRVVIQKALGADHELTVVETSRRGHATRFAQDAAARGVDVVVALGGDGTLNETANGLIGTSCALAPLPGGSTNVFARTLGYPNDPIEATGALVDALAAGSFHRVGVGTANGRVFLFHTGIGYDAAVVEEVERRHNLKRWAGHPLFVYAALVTWARRFDRRHPHFTIELGDGEVLDRGFFTIAMKTNPYTYLGNRPLDLVHDVGLGTPLALVHFRTLSARRVLGAIGAALRGGGISPNRSVLVRPGVVHAVVHADPPVPYQVDGDHLGEVGRLELRYVPDALTLVVPADVNPPDVNRPDVDPPDVNPPDVDPRHVDPADRRPPS